MWILGKHAAALHTLWIISNVVEFGKCKRQISLGAVICHSLLKNARQMKFIVPHEHTLLQRRRDWQVKPGVVLSQEWAQCTQCHFTISTSDALSACSWIWHWIVLIICSLRTLHHHRIMNGHKNHISGESVNVSCSGKTHQHKCFRVYKPVSRKRFTWKQN